MKSIGIVRKLDDLGRIVLPVEMRRTLGIEDKDQLEISVQDNAIVLRKYQPACIFCGSTDRVISYKDHIVCEDCLREIAQNHN